MKTLTPSLRSFLRDESGPTSVEYAVLLSLIILACIGAIRGFGISLSGSFSNSVDKIEEAVHGSN